jgi:hypothetical protein
VILHEQPSGGKTIIEKYETYSADVAYAVVLLTPDDRGGTAAAPYEEQKLCARQNMILERSATSSARLDAIACVPSTSRAPRSRRTIPACGVSKTAAAGTDRSSTAVP